jgi:hypothetical protein
MQKKMMIAVVLVGLFLVFTNAQGQKVVTKAAQKSAPVVKVAKNLEPIKLDGKQWEVEMYPSRGTGNEKPILDKLTFRKGKVISERYSKDGFGPTNYTLSLKDDGTTTVWETMQNSSKGTLSWHGQVKRDTMAMRGVVSERPPKAEKSTINYNFGGTKWVEVKDELEGEAKATEAGAIEKAPQEEVKAPVVTKEPVKEETKKKSWW